MFLSTVLLLTTPRAPLFEKRLIFLIRTYSRNNTKAWSRKAPSVPEKQSGDSVKGPTQWVHRWFFHGPEATKLESLALPPLCA